MKVASPPVRVQIFSQVQEGQGQSRLRHAAVPPYCGMYQSSGRRSVEDRGVFESWWKLVSLLQRF